MKGNIGRIEMRAPEMPSIMLLAGVAGARPDGGMRRTLVVWIFAIFFCSASLQATAAGLTLYTYPYLYTAACSA
jgi:hypothetical protein